MKQVRIRIRAGDDLVELAQYYGREGGPALAERFFDVAVGEFARMQRRPGLGSPRLGALCGLPELRSRPVAHFPARWFYIDAPDHIDVLRLLADAQDILAILGEESKAENTPAARRSDQ